MRPKVSKEVVVAYGLRQAQVDNLCRLHDLLLTVPPPEFDMQNWLKIKRLSKAMVDAWGGRRYNVVRPDKVAKVPTKAWYAKSCGTSCCAMGLAAINKIGKPDCYSTFREYAFRAFGADAYNGVFPFLFDTFWWGVDNTPEGAAARIAWFLARGVPENVSDMQIGKAKLVYRRMIRRKVKLIYA